LQGFIALHRELLDKPIWKKSTPEQKSILVTLLLLANHEETEWEWMGQRFKVAPGQFVTSLESLAEKSGTSIKNVRTALLKFQNYEFLANESTKTGRLITLTNWGVYQSTNQQNGKDNGKEVAKTWQRPGKEVATNNNDNNDNNDNNEIKEEDIYSQNPPETTPQICPYQEIVKTYHDNCPSLPKVRDITDNRKKTMKARWKKYRTIEAFKISFIKAEQSEFLSGRSGKWTACNFDWLINESNMVKVLEGQYDNKASPQDIPLGFSSIQNA
jgi:DNA replication protein DnaD